MAGSDWGSFASGFGSALSGQILESRNRQDRMDREAAARRAQLGAVLLPHAIENAENPDDLRDIFKMIDPNFEKGATRGKPGGFDSIKGILGKVFSSKPTMFPQKGGWPNGENPGYGAGIPGGPPTDHGGIGSGGSLDARLKAIGVVPFNPNASIGGSPSPGPQQAPAPAQTQTPATGGGDINALLDRLMAQQQGGASVPAPAQVPAGATAAGQPSPTGGTFHGIEYGTPAQRDAKKIQRAREVYQQMHTVDPSFSIDDAFAVVGIRLPRTAGSGAPYQSIPGEVVDENGKIHPANGVFDRTSGTYFDADTHQPLKGFRPRTTTASSGSTGTIGNRAAVALGYDSAAEAIAAGKQAELTAKMSEIRQSDAFASGTGTGNAKIQTELKTPIGPSAAQLYNVAPTTTLGELSNTVTMTPAQREKIGTMGQIDTLLTDIETLVPKVFPNVPDGMWGRIQSQISLGIQKASADEDYAQLESSLNAAMAQIAQLSGQPGSRLSDKDIDLARSTLAQLTPSVFGGDTLKSAQARLRIVRQLFEKAQGNVVQPALPTGGAARQTTTPAAAATTPAAAGLVRGADGTWYRDGVGISGPGKGKPYPGPGR